MIRRARARKGDVVHIFQGPGAGQKAVALEADTSRKYNIKVKLITGPNKDEVVKATFGKYIISSD